VAVNARHAAPDLENGPGDIQGKTPMEYPKAVIQAARTRRDGNGEMPSISQPRVFLIAAPISISLSGPGFSSAGKILRWINSGRTNDIAAGAAVRARNVSG
jgi:hypothetical protein